jgi:uncharacterized membrane protein
MDLDQIAHTLIYIHATFGGFALLTGGIALIVKKGGKLHKKSGKVFYYTLLISAFLSLAVAVMPKHHSPFLFSIGVFSCYFIVGGYRSLRFKQAKFDLKWDKIISYTIIITGIAMILYPVLLHGKLNMVLLVFGLVGLLFGMQDLRAYKDSATLQKKWLKMHLGKMIGGYIASVTAFFVVSQILPGIWNWFVPGLVGGAYISFWSLKLKRSSSLQKTTSKS